MTWRSNQQIWIVMSIVLMAFVSPSTAKVIFVDGEASGANNGLTWADAFNDLQDALAAACSGDEIRVAQGVYSPEGPLLYGRQASNPNPANGATAVSITADLSWTAGSDATSHDVYFGTTSPGMFQGNQSGTSFDPGTMAYYTTYYWRIDELNNGSKTTGIIWSFRTVGPGPGSPPPDLSIPPPPLDRTASFQLINGVVIKGGYAGFGEPDPNTRDIEAYETILSGDLAGNDIEVDPCDLLTEPTRAENSYHVVTGNDTDETAVLDGVTITSGNANGDDSGQYHGGGMFNHNGSPTLVKCILSYNSAKDVGGGMYNHGGMYNYQGSPTLDRCIFSKNYASGGAGFFTYTGNPTLTCCTFRRNWAAISAGGGICNYYSRLTVKNCVFNGNLAYLYGGAMYNNYYSSSTLINCNFYSNSAGNYGGGIFWQEPGPPPPGGYQTPALMVINCILWANSDTGGVNEPAQIYSVAIPTLNYNCIQGLTGALGGTGNIDADPLFVDADGADNVPSTEDDNLRLLPGSPCIDAGDNSALPPSVVTDFDGDSRIANGIVDMGAYEGPDQGFLLSAESVIVGEDQTATFTVALAMDPCGTFDVNVAHYSGDTDITVQSGEHLIFDSNNYSQPKTITLAANEDSDSINGQALFRLSGHGLPPSGVTATEQDNDTILYVDTRAVAGANNGSNWANAFTDLQEALTTASIQTAVNEIIVAQGIYTPAGPGGDRIASFQLINGVALKGGYAGFGEPDPNARNIELYETILSGDLNGDDGPNFVNYEENSYHVVTGDYTDETAVLDGFTIIAGNANEQPPSPHVIGGGMCNNGGSPTLTNCVFISNFSFSGGGISNNGSSPMISNCKFIGNQAWPSNGGGMRNTYSAPILTNCIFIWNTAGRTGGGGMANLYSSPLLTNCTFIGNSADGRGGGMYSTMSEPILTNCILWGNINGQIEGSAFVSYSDVQGGWPGLGNINEDPCFANVNNGDYHLKSQAGRWDPNSESWIRDDVTSPCIDAGNPGCPEANEPVPNGNRRNMGAYGGTAEASKSPTYWRSIADMTNDWIVDSNDLKVFCGYWLQTGECIPSDFDRSQFVDSNDFAILGGQWRQKGPGPGIAYDIGGCIPVDFTSSALVESEPTRFTVTVEGRYIYFEDMMRANCCPEELDVQMTVEDDLITIYEIEHTPMPCPCLCDFPITATFGPFQPGTYTLDVYQKNTFIGTTTVTITPGG